MSTSALVTVGKRRLTLSNLDKVLYPASGFTKAQVIEYYAKVAPVLLPHLKGRAVTLKRYPDGVDGQAFFSKNCPAHRPPWFKTVIVHGEQTVEYCLIEEVASLIWVANLAALELHVPLEKATSKQPDRPTAVIFDLDPGPPAGMTDCARLALTLRHTLEGVRLQSFVKTSGAKGLHVLVPMNTAVTFEQTQSFARAVATVLAKADPKRVTANMSKAGRGGKVFIDWNQNELHQTTVCAYSLRAAEHPTASTPLGWEEVERAAGGRSSDRPLSFTAQDVLERAAGEYWAPSLTLKQYLPAGTASSA
jgi:bifunctional non-homologous end joining protein LigD